MSTNNDKENASHEEQEASINQIRLISYKGREVHGSVFTQIVNLSNNDHFNALPRKNVGLGQELKFMVDFNKYKADQEFSYKIEPFDTNQKYSSAEKGRNNGKFDKPKKNHCEYQKDKTDYYGGKVIESEISVSPAGNDIFRIIAEDKKGKIVKSKEIVTQRVFWIEPMIMKGIGCNIVNSSYRKLLLSFDPIKLLKRTVERFQPFGINIQVLDTKMIDYEENINTNDNTVFRKFVNDANNNITNKKIEKFCLPFVFYDRDCHKDQLTITQTFYCKKKDNYIRLNIKNAEGELDTFGIQS